MSPPNSSLIVRPATMNDHETLLQFTLDEAEEAEGRVEDPEVLSNAIKNALLDPEGKARYFVALSSNQLRGHVSVTREWSDWNNASYLWITSMYVTPELRGQGVMGALIEAVESEARQIGAPEIRIYVHETNHRASRAWMREGFTQAPYWMGHRQVSKAPPHTLDTLQERS